MSYLYELNIASYELIRNEAVKAYFDARPFLVRNTVQEKLVEAGFRIGWEAFQQSQLATKEANNV